MKRIVLALAALATVAAPLAVTTTASAQSRGNPRYDQRDNRGGYTQRGPGSYNPGRDGRGPGSYNPGRDNRGPDNRGWDRNRYNGYYLGSRFYYGPPPVSYYGRYDYRPAYSAWHRGGYLPRSYWNSQYIVYDYGRYGLYAPPRGYRWYNVNGDYVLAAIVGGLIAEAFIR